MDDLKYNGEFSGSTEWFDTGDEAQRVRHASDIIIIDNYLSHASRGFVLSISI